MPEEKKTLSPCRLIARAALGSLAAAGGYMWFKRQTTEDLQAMLNWKNGVVLVFSSMMLRRLVGGFKKQLPTDKVEFEAVTKKGTTGVLLVNLGTPDGTSVPALRKYLTEFLSDDRVVDAPAHCRWMLVNLIIAPFRSPKSAEMYKRIWDDSMHHTNEGSPLMKHGMDLVRKVKQNLRESGHSGKIHVELAMRYQQPSLEEGLLSLKRKCVEHIVVIPLFPQYSSACTGSIHQKVFEILGKWDRIPHLTLNSTLIDAAGFVDCFATTAKDMMKNEYDEYIFSYHGVPVKQMTKGSVECRPDSDCKTGCCSSLTERNALCYRAQCHETTRRIAALLKLPEDKFMTTFQSRLGPTQWLKPYTDNTIDAKAEAGTKRILVFSPAFVADCLETLDELGSELKHQFVEGGGEVLDLVPSLNGNQVFVNCISDLIRKLAVY